MKKKIILVLLSMCLSVSAAACGSSESEPSGNTSEDNVTSEAETSEQDSKIDEEVQTEITVNEQELFNENGITITAKGFSNDGIFGPEVNVLIENNSDKNITVQTRNSSVNGYMVDFQISSEVAPGKKINDSMILMNTDLENSGISTICDMEFSFHIFDSDSWDTFVDSEPIIINTSASGTYEQNYDDSGDVIFDNNDIKIISKGISENDSLMGPALYLYIENNSDKDITVQSRDTSIDGFMIEPIFSSDVISGKKAVDTMVIMSTDIEDNGIEAIEEIETSFHIFDTDSWDTIVDTDPIIIKCN